MNVVVVVAHGLGCHWLGPYGNAWVATPAADALACEAVVFDRHFADDPSPAGFRRALPPSMFAALRAAGVATLLVDDRNDHSPDGRDWDVHLATEPDRHPKSGDALLRGRSSRRWTGFQTETRGSSGSKPTAWCRRGTWNWRRISSTRPRPAGSPRKRIRRPNRGRPSRPTNRHPGRSIWMTIAAWHRLHNSFAAAVTAFDGELGELVRRVPGPRARPVGRLDRHVRVRLAARRARSRRPGRVADARGTRPPAADRAPAGPPPGDAPGAGPYPDVRSGPDAVRAVRRRDPAGSGRDLTPAADRRNDGRAGDRWPDPRTGPERAIRTPDWAFLPAVSGSDVPARLYRKPDDIWEVNDLAPRHPDECDRLAAAFDPSPETEPTP